MTAQDTMTKAATQAAAQMRQPPLAVIGKSKAALVLEQAFFASILCGLDMHEDNSVPTMATNGKFVKYNRKFVESMTFDETKFVLCHEVGHCVFMHMFRRGDRDPRTWNQAGDYIINEWLTNANIGEMPQGGLYNPALTAAGGGTTDGVYNIIYQENKQGGGGGFGGIAGHGDPMDDCQDAAGDASEVAAEEAQMAQTVAQAAQAAKMCGQGSATIDQVVAAALKPKIDWKAVLREFVSRSAKTERSWARPNRRFIAQGMYLPTMAGEAMGEIVFAEDHSGSVSQDEKHQNEAEINAVVEDCRPSALNVIYFTDRVCAVDRFEQGDPVVFDKNFTGGTAFSPIFAEIEERGIEPVCVVVLTDLCCDDFGPQPDYPVLWVSTMRGTAPWGEVVLMHGNDL